MSATTEVAMHNPTDEYPTIPDDAGIAMTQPMALHTDEEPVSGIRPTPAELARQASQTILDHDDDHHAIDDLTKAAFRVAVAKTDAIVGLLHRRTDAFLFTTAVHRLDAGLHLFVGLSFWDPAVQMVMCGKVVAGEASDGGAAASVARRLGADLAPRFVLSIPVMVDGCIEAILELGRDDRPFSDETVRSTMRSVYAMAA